MIASRSRRKPGRPAHPIARSELLARARVVFAEHGYAAASLSRIAEVTGLRKASLYHHFTSKEELYLAVLDELVDDLRRMIVDAGLEQGGFVERLDALGSLYVDYFAKNSDAAGLLMRELVNGGEYLQRRGGHAIENTLGIMAGFLQAGMDARVFFRQDPKQLALSILGAHLCYFAAAKLSSTFVGRDIYEADAICQRKAELIAHMRSLCLADETGARCRTRDR